MITPLLAIALAVAFNDLKLDGPPGDSDRFATPVGVAEGAQARGPDLGVALLRSGPDPRPLVAPGQAITISVGVYNLRGDADAHNSMLTILVPGGLAVKGAKPASDRTEPDKDGTRLSWNLGTVAARALPRLFEVDLQAAPDLKKGMQLSVAASVTTTDRDANEKNNRVALTLAVENAAAYLFVESTLDSVPFTVDDPIEFTTEVKNLGTTAAAACELTMTIPPKVSFTSSAPTPAATNASGATWKLGDIAPSESRAVSISLRLDRSLRSAAYGFAGKHGLLEFTFDATTTTNQIDPATGHLKVARYPQPSGSNVKIWLSVDGVENPGELPVGKDVTYEIRYGNYGNEPARQVSVSLSLPEGLSVVGAQPSPARSGTSDKFAGGVLSWNLGDLAVGRGDLIRSKVHVTSVATAQKFVEATISAGGDHNIVSRKDTAYAWYGPPRVRESPRVARRQLSVWTLLLFAVLVVGAFAVLVWRRRTRRTG